MITRAQLVVLAPKAAMDAVSPDIDDWLVIEGSVSPAVVLLGPIHCSLLHLLRDTYFDLLDQSLGMSRANY